MPARQNSSAAAAPGGVRRGITADEADLIFACGYSSFNPLRRLKGRSLSPPPHRPRKYREPGHVAVPPGYRLPSDFDARQYSYKPGPSMAGGEHPAARESWVPWQSRTSRMPDWTGVTAGPANWAAATRLRSPSPALVARPSPVCGRRSPPVPAAAVPAAGGGAAAARQKGREGRGYDFGRFVDHIPAAQQRGGVDAVAP